MGTDKSPRDEGLIKSNKLFVKIIGGASTASDSSGSVKPVNGSAIESAKFTEPRAIEAASDDSIVSPDKEDLKNATPLLPCQGSVKDAYKVYPDRWWLLVAVVLLNLANYSHWVAFPSVAKSGAKYYDQSGKSMDLIPTVSYGLGVPCCLIATYIVEKYGLKTGLHIGGFLTGIGKNQSGFPPSLSHLRIRILKFCFNISKNAFQSRLGQRLYVFIDQEPLNRLINLIIPMQSR